MQERLAARGGLDLARGANKKQTTLTARSNNPPAPRALSASPKKTVGKLHVPLGEDGAGLYSEATKGCFNVIDASRPLVEDAIASIPKPAAGVPYSVADFGTADAGTSLPLMHSIVQQIRETEPSRDVSILYEDQPSNEWRSVFNYSQGLKRLDGVPLYSDDFENVFVTASGTSFHQQCFPSGTVQLGVCYTAMHWLSEQPCELTECLHSCQATGEEKEKFEAVAAADWERILLARAAELAPGGRLVLANFTVDEDGYYLGHSDVGPNMYSNFRSLWRGLVDEGVITEDEFKRCTFYSHYRTKEEACAPFQEGTKIWEAGLRLVSCESKLTRCPYRRTWEENGGDPAIFAKNYVPTTRTWSNSTFFNALSDERSFEERTQIVNDFFQAYEDLVAQDPTGHGMDYVHQYMVISKV